MKMSKKPLFFLNQGQSCIFTQNEIAVQNCNTAT